MQIDRVRKVFFDSRRTLLGAGPMSRTSTLAVIDLANSTKREIALIPSRRQVECKELGNGYVENWSTEEFVKFVRTHDHGKFVLLSRDHSGPWQNSENDYLGNALSHNQAMVDVKKSLEVDLELGFDLIHIDPSQGLRKNRSQLEVEEDIYELLEFCSSRNKFGTFFEIGADEQSLVPDSVAFAEANLLRILNNLRKFKLPHPLFYVLQTGTKTMETKNIGSFDAKLPVVGMLPAMVQVPELIKMCQKHSIYLKEHNADYLSDRALMWHRRFGIHAANVAPEFGVCETRALIEASESHMKFFFYDSLAELVLNGTKWKKWLIEENLVTDREKVLIAGHYYFSHPQIIEARSKLAIELSKNQFDLERFIYSEVKNSINRYLFNFGYYAHN